MSSPVSDDDRTFLSRLNRLEKPTVQSLCDAVGVTATAVRHRLTRLEDAKLIERVRLETGGRGRPAYGYRLTEKGRGSLGDNSTMLAQALWREVVKIKDETIRETLLDRVRESLAEQYGGITGDTPSERLSSLSERLRSLGLDVDMKSENDGMLPVLQEHCCPFSDVACEDGSICELEEQVFSAVVGVPVRLQSHSSNGGGCCEFVIADQSVSDKADTNGKAPAFADSALSKGNGVEPERDIVKQEAEQ